MKTLLQLAVFASLCLPVCAQSWVTVVPAKQQAPMTSVSLPVGTTYRFLSLNGKATTPAVATAAPVSDWDDGLSGRPLDPEPGVGKDMQVLQSAGFYVSVIDASVSPARKTPIFVPALKPTYLITCTGTGTLTGTTMTITNSTCTAAVKQ